MTLEEAYSVGKKYGFTFNGIGPSFSLINNKVGICLNLLDQKYGYLKRNFSFENLNELDDFLKKYSFYLRNKDKDNIYLLLDNYEIENPIIHYSFDIIRKSKEQVENYNKNVLLADIKQFLNSFYLEFDKVINNVKEKLLIEQDYYTKFNYYKKLLYRSYNQEINDNIIKVDDTIKAKIAKIFETFKKEQLLFLNAFASEDKSIEEVENWYKQLIFRCQEVLIEEEIIKVFYEKRKFEENTDTLNKMIDYLLNNSETTEIAQKKLQQIKDSAILVESYDTFVNDYKSKIKEKYLTLDLNDVLSYNPSIYGTKRIEYKVYHEEKIINNDITEIKPLYYALSEESKIALTLLYSPLKPILNYIIEQAYRKNTSFNFNTREFKNIYQKLIKCLDNSENLVVKLKYFKPVMLENYDLFIKSLVKIAKIICSSYLKLPFDLKLYSLNFDDCFITGSDRVIQNGDSVVKIVDAKANSFIIYSPVKINLNSKNNLFELENNNNVIYFPNFNNKCIDSDIVTNVAIFEEGYNVINVAGDNLLVVTNFSLQNKLLFIDTVMSGISKDEK